MIERYKSEEILDLRAQKYFWNSPPGPRNGECSNQELDHFYMGFMNEMSIHLLISPIYMFISWSHFNIKMSFFQYKESISV